jgi:DNA-binding protein YbaB
VIEPSGQPGQPGRLPGPGWPPAGPPPAGPLQAGQPAGVPPPPPWDMPETQSTSASHAASRTALSRTAATRRDLPGARLAGEVAELAAGMRSAAADLAAAAAAASLRRYEARSGDDAVAVTVDGSPRVISIRLDGSAAGHRSARLEAALTATVNQALDTARQAGAEALLGAAGPGLEPFLRGAADAAESSAWDNLREETAAWTATASSADGRVTASVSGRGMVTGITVSDGRLRHRDQAGLGEAAAEAVNAALGALARGARGSRAAARPPGDPQSAGNATVQALHRRMDALLAQLNRIERGLDRAVGGATPDITE